MLPMGIQRLALGGNGSRVYRKFLYYFCNIFGSLRSFQYEKLKNTNKIEYTPLPPHNDASLWSPYRIKDKDSSPAQRPGVEALQTFWFILTKATLHPCPITCGCYNMPGIFATRLSLSGQHFFSTMKMVQTPTHLSNHRSYSSHPKKFFLNIPGVIKHLLWDFFFQFARPFI